LTPMVMTVSRCVGGILFLYAIYQMYTNLTQLLPPVRDRKRRTSWEVANWLVDYVKIMLITITGIVLLRLS